MRSYRPAHVNHWVSSCFLWALFLVVPYALSLDAHGKGWEVGGHLKYQFIYTAYEDDDFGALFGKDGARDHGIDLRLKAARRWGRWDMDIHYQLLALAGDSVGSAGTPDGAAASLFAVSRVLPDDRHRLFDFTAEITSTGRAVAVQRLDRLSIRYSAPRMVVRFGRQAVSWGNGLVFNPLDFLNPFSPVAIDKDYKTGDDMLYGQWLGKGGGDTEVVIVPRREPRTGQLEDDRASIALKQHGQRGDVEYDLLVARHYGNAFLGFGLALDWGGAVWRGDVGVSELQDGGYTGFVVTNLDRSWVWGGRNVYGYLEYFHNGLGKTREAYADPGIELGERMARGELFTLGRDYLATGLQIEWTPRLDVAPLVLWNLNDGSGLTQLRLSYNWKQDLYLSAGLNFALGARGTEFGGIPVKGIDGYAPVGDRAYMRIAYFF